MKNLFYILLWNITLMQSTFASWSLGIYQWLGEGGVERLRNWDINTDDIPKIIVWATDFLMGIAGTVAIIFIIIWAYKMAIGSATENSTAEWKKTVFLALGWFILASISWIIFKLIIDNFT